MTPRKHKLRAITLLTAAIFLLFARAEVRAAAGDLYVSLSGPGGDVVRISPDGTQHPVISNLVGPSGMAFDSKGVLYVGQFDGTIVKVVNGAPVPFSSGMANQSSFGLAFDKFDTLYVTEPKNGVVTRVSPNGTKTIVASSLPIPFGLAVDQAGNYFVGVFGASVNEGIIYKFAPTGRTTFASSLRNPNGLAFDLAGYLYEADTASGTIKKFTPMGANSVFASVPGVRYLAFALNGDLYAADNVNTISKVTPGGTVSTFKLVGSVSGLAVEPALAQPLNISTRLNVQTGDNALIGGFIATGTAPKKVVVRAIGPSLSNSGISTPLQDPTLELRSANGSLIASNDNWKINEQTNQSQQAAIQATGLAPTDDRESVLMAELAPAGYTAIVRGKNDTSGVGLVEIYDVNQTADSRLANISTRGYLESSDSVMIAGVIIRSGNGAAKLLVRVLGPSLTAFGITNALPDPYVDIRDSNGTRVAFNDDWQVREGNIISQQAEIEATGIPPSDDLESAVIVTLPVGNYTAITSSFGTAAVQTGVAIIEVYNLR